MWRRVIFGFVIPILGLVIVGYLSFAWVSTLMDSLADYRSPIREELPAGKPLKPLTDALILVIVDGLRYDVAKEMPFLNELAGRGAEATVIGEPPSYSHNTWTTLVTGASPHISGAPVFNQKYEVLQPISADHLFASASRHGLSTAICGSRGWGKLIQPEFRQAGAFSAGEDAAADQAIVEVALALLQGSPPQFLLIHVSQVDHAGHDYGATSQEYQEAALRVDEHLRAIARRLDLSRQTIVVVSDHGHINRGGHGGQDRAALTTRLVAAGRGIRPGGHSEMRQTDVAPTLAALLGIGIPNRNEGRFNDALLAWDSEARARAWAALAKGRLALASAYLRGIGRAGSDGSLEARGQQIEQWLTLSRWEDAYQEAMSLSLALDEQIARARHEREKRERWERLWMPLAYGALLGLIVWRNRRRKGELWVGPALLALVTYHLLFIAGGNPYSLSGLTGQTPFLLGMGIRTLAGLICGWLWVILACRRHGQTSRSRLAQATLSYGWLTMALLLLLIIALAWWMGPTVSWALPDFLAVFLLFTSQVQLMLVAGGSLLLAGVAALTGKAFASDKEIHDAHCHHGTQRTTGPMPSASAGRS